jgi:hypothetical protein
MDSSTPTFTPPVAMMMDYSTLPSKRSSRPGVLPLLGYSYTPQILTFMRQPILFASLSNGGRVVARVRCVDNILPGAKVRTIHTDAGRVKVPANFTLMAEKCLDQYPNGA